VNVPTPETVRLEARFEVKDAALGAIDNTALEDHT
jgi:hypothetical protein